MVTAELTEYSRLITSDYKVHFRADRRYTVKWGQYKSSKIGYPLGFGALAWGKHSITEYTIQGSLVNEDTNDEGSAEKQLYNNLLPLARESQSVAIPATCYLVTGNGTITLTGWVINFNAIRDAPKGEVIVDITFNFFLKTYPVLSGGFT